MCHIRKNINLVSSVNLYFFIMFTRTTNDTTRAFVFYDVDVTSYYVVVRN